MQHQLHQGWDIKGGKTTLAEYLPLWLENKRLSIRTSTAYQYGLMIKNHILKHLGSVALKDLLLARVERFYRKLLKDGASPRTVRYVHGVLHRAMEKAVMYDLIMRNPAHGAALPKYAHAEMTILDEFQVSQFLLAARGSNYEVLYHLAIKTGMRQGEIFGLKWSDVQWTSGVIHVQRQVSRVPGYS